MGDEKSKFLCPNCKSEEIKKATVIKSMGSMSYSGDSLGVGISGSGIGVGVGLHDGRIVSKLAEKLNPPCKPATGWEEKNIRQWRLVSILLCIFMWLLTFILGSDGLSGAVTFFVLFTLPSTIFAIYAHSVWLPRRNGIKKDEGGRKVVPNQIGRMGEDICMSEMRVDLSSKSGWQYEIHFIYINTPAF